MAFKSTMKMASKAAKSAAGFLFGGEIFPTSSTSFATTTTPQFSDPIVKYNNNNNNFNENMNENNDVYDYDDKDSTNVFEEDESSYHLGSNPGPPYSSNVLGVPPSLELQTNSLSQNSNSNNNNNKKNENELSKNFSVSESVRNKDLDPGTLSYDPVSDLSKIAFASYNFFYIFSGFYLIEYFY